MAGPDDIWYNSNFRNFELVVHPCSEWLPTERVWNVVEVSDEELVRVS